MKSGRWGSGLLVGAVALVAVGAGVAWWSFWDRVDPGNAGVLIDYCTGTSETITDARYVFVDPRCKRLAEYPTAEYTLEMVGAGTQNDQSVPCVMQDQQTIRMDTATAWSVDQVRVGDLYRMRPGVVLYGDSRGQDISTLVVRSEVRAGIRDACTKFGWEETYGARRAEYELEAERAVQARLEPVGIKVRTVSIRAMDPSTQLDALIEARLNGQRAIEQARFEQAQAERQGDAQLAQQRAAANLQAAQSETALAKARADADQAKVAAEAEAVKVRTLAEAEAYANRQRADSLTPSLVEYERWRRWNGQMPQTVLGGDPNVRIDVPVPAAAR